MPQSGLRGSRAAAAAWVALALIVLGLSVALCTRALRRSRLKDGGCQAAEAASQAPADDLTAIVPMVVEVCSESAKGVTGEMPTLLSAGPVRENAQVDAKN